MCLEESKGKKFSCDNACKNEKGLALIFLKLQDNAVRENFYYRPVILLKELLENSEGLIMLSGCSSGLFTMLIRERSDKIEYYLNLFKETFGDDFYAEIQPQNIEDNQVIMEQLHKIAKEKNIKVCIY